MAKDKIRQRYEKKEEKGLLGSLFKRTVSPDLLTQEEEMLAHTPPVDPIEAADEPGRNDPCPCGSGKKYKKCCGRKEKK